MTATRNGRYTQGAQAAQITAIGDSLDRIETVLNTYIARQSAYIEALRTEAEAEHARMSASITSSEKNILILEHEAKISNRLLAAFTAIASVIAAAVGINAKQ